MLEGAACPISGKRADDTVSRMNAVVVLFGLLAAMAFGWWWLTALLAADFAVKVFVECRRSPLAMLLARVRDALGWQPHPVDAAPKRFAAGLGLVFCGGATVACLLAPGSVAFYAIAGMCAFCAALEGFFDYCLGCQVYMLLRPILPKPKLATVPVKGHDRAA